MKKRIFVIGAALAACLLAVLGVRYAPALFNAGGGSGRDMPVYDLCAGENDLWVVYNMDGGFSEFGVYSYGKEERGTESRPRLEGRPCWEGTSERFWYLEKDSLQAYDPVTGAVTAHPLDRAYQQIGAAAADAVVLQEETGAVWLYLPENGMEAQLSVPAGMILRGDYDGCIVVKTDGADGTRDLICWDYRNDRQLWKTNLSGRFADGYEVTVCGDAVYLCYKDVSMIWQADLTDGVFTPLKERKALKVAGAENALICAGWAPWGSAIYAIYPDGTEEQLGNLEDEDIFQKYDPIRLAVWDGKVYCGRVEEGEIFAYDLPPVTADTAEPLAQLPVYLPRAKYAAFFNGEEKLDRKDEFLYESILGTGWPKISSDDELTIPTVRVYDEWEEDGGTYYLCGVTFHFYRGLADQLAAGRVDVQTAPLHKDGGMLFRIRVEKQRYGKAAWTYGSWLVTEILRPSEKGDNGASYRELCAGRPILEYFLDDVPGELPYLRDLLPEEYNDSRVLLRRYLETYFPGRIME